MSQLSGAITAWNNCATCSRVKHPTQQARAPKLSICSGYPNQRLGIDFVGLFLQSRRGNQYILVLVDFFTKWAEAIPIRNQEAVTVAQAIYNHWVCVFGAPDAIHSDLGSNFESHLIRAFCAALGLLCWVVTPQIKKGSRTQRQIEGIKTLVYYSAQAHWRRPVLYEITSYFENYRSWPFAQEMR